MTLTVITGPLPVVEVPIDTSWIEPNTLVGGSIEMPPFAYDLYMAMEPLHYAEAELGFPLAHYCMALGEMFRRVDEITRQGETAVIMDPNTVPVAGIPWLGQFIGLTINPQWSEQNQRNYLYNRSGFQRGTPRGMAAAAQQFLTGTQTVMLYERYEDNPWRLHVVTIDSETADPDLVLQALMNQKPAGIVLTYQEVSSETYDELAAAHATYNAVAAAHPDYDDITE